MFSKVFKTRALTDGAKNTLSPLRAPESIILNAKQTDSQNPIAPHPSGKQVSSTLTASAVVVGSSGFASTSKPNRYASSTQVTPSQKDQATKIDFVCETDPNQFQQISSMDEQLKQKMLSQTSSIASHGGGSGNQLPGFMRSSEMSSSHHSRSLKDLSSMDYLRMKRAQSREKGEYYDLKTGAVYRNYKYERVKLTRPELTFLESKPLDFVGKMFAAPTSKDAQGRVIHRTEDAIENLKRQKQIIEFGAAAATTTATPASTLKQSPQAAAAAAAATTSAAPLLLIESENETFQEIKKKLQSKILSSQHNLYPFDQQAKIAKDLKKLDQKISYSLSSHSRISNNNTSTNIAAGATSTNSLLSPELPALFNSTNNSDQMFLSSSSSRQTQQQHHHWVSPLIKHESMRMKHQSGSELILKNEIIEAAAVSAASEFRRNNQLKNQAEYSQQMPSNAKDIRRMSTDETGICLSVIHFNKAFKGKGQNMRSKIRLPESNKEKKSLVTGEMVVSHVQKESQYLRLVKEYNRLLEMDKNEQAISRTKRIKTKREEKVDENALLNKVGDLEQCLSQKIFLRETAFFAEALRPEPEIRARILHGILNKYGGLSFEGYLNFYKIFLFQKTDRNILIAFLVRFFCYSPEQRVLSITKQTFLDTLALLSNHKGLLDAPECIAAWQTGLDQKESLALIDVYREKHIREIFEEELVNPDLILKLLFA